jgi:hypothetical protein
VPAGLVVSRAIDRSHGGDAFARGDARTRAR